MSRKRRYMAPCAKRLLHLTRTYPVAHPLWLSFVQWVETNGVGIRHDLLTSQHDQDWELVWAVFKAGASHGPRYPRRVGCKDEPFETSVPTTGGEPSCDGASQPGGVSG